MDRHAFDEGVQCLVQAHEAEPLNVGAWVNSGNAYHRCGRADVARDLYRRALQISPDESMGDGDTFHLIFLDLGRHA